VEFIDKYFSDLSARQKEQFALLYPLYHDWNEKINVISRKDIENIYLHHVLHSLAIAKVIRFKAGTEILDVGTGGGFPGIPLAIMFPETAFHLVDSIGKKIKVVKAIAEALELKNVKADQLRAEDVKGLYDFVVSRAVAALSDFVPMVMKNICKTSINDIQNGILYLKGGDIRSEMVGVKADYKLFPVSEMFEEKYFEEKFVVHIFRGDSDVIKKH
jgi:16S rRNA (guanine527-N7)-methyltransferase